MLFQSGHSFQPTFSHLEQRMWASHYFLRKRYSSLGCADSVWLPLQIHAACVEPAGSFASELWGAYQQHSAGRQRLEAARLRQLRQLTGLGPAVALPIVWRDLGREPFSYAWLLRASGTHWLPARASTGTLRGTLFCPPFGVRRTTGCVACAAPCPPWGTVCSWTWRACSALTLVTCAAACQRSWPPLGLASLSARAPALLRGRACALICNGLLDLPLAKLPCCGCRCPARRWSVFCDSGRAAMLCQAWLAAGGVCPALSGSALCASLRTMTSGTRCLSALRWHT